MAVYEKANEDLLDAAGDEAIDDNMRTELMKMYEVSDLRARMKGCEKCKIRKECKQVVPFKGTVSMPGKQVMLCGLGEAPGQDEDEHGDPFVGECGAKVDKVFRANKMDPNKIPMLNVLGCRPWKWEKNKYGRLYKKDRVPLAEELKNCRGWLLEQMELIDPFCYLVFGASALKVVAPTLKITQCHGKFFKIGEGLPGAGKLAYATFHPGATLDYRDEDGSKDKAFREDIAHLGQMWNAWEVFKCDRVGCTECEYGPGRILMDQYEILEAQANMRQAKAEATLGGFLDFTGVEL